MKTPTHTPGPWKLDIDGRMIESEYPVNFRGEFAHICDFRPDLSGAIQLADAKLIAAAPDLLRGCQAALAYLADPASKFKENRQAAVEIIEAALAKATE